jgi:D-glycero-D-manno-heptose 1,7-bisphosphate phosphatase
VGIDPLKRKAVFLDRDGVLNDNWYNPETGEWESPIAADQVKLCNGALDALRNLREMGYLLFLVSNQPSAAKAKCTIADLQSVHVALVRALETAGIFFERFFYAYGHPLAVVPELRDTKGRKPDPYFVNLAVSEFEIDRSQSWMIGDRSSDIECGQRAGVRTIQVQALEPDDKEGATRPEFQAANLRAAVRIIAAENST